MSTRNINHNASGDNGAQHEAALQHAIGYIREFSAHAATYQQQRTEESLVLLNRSTSLLSTTIQPQHFAPIHLEIAKFFIDLHGLMGALDTDSDALWSCVTLLQHAARNLEARQAIVEKYRFVALLSFILKRTKKHERVHKLLVLLQDLTYGISITWEEPYLVVLLELLVNIVHTDTDDDESTHALLSLSILVNLCYKNFVVLFLFLRSVNISSFSRRIQNFGILADKMLILISEDTHAFEQRELRGFLRNALASVDECIKLWNVPYMRHIVDFLFDSKRHRGLHNAMLCYENYCDDIERLLEHIDARCNMDDSSEDARKHQQICIGLFFQLINYILEMSAVRDAEGHENIISIDSIVPRIFELLCNWLESDICGVDAIRLLDALLRLTKPESIATRVARNPSIIAQLISSTEGPESNAAHTSAVLQLLLTLLRQSKTEKLILSKITESYFDKILAPLLTLKPELTNKHSLPQSEIEKCIFCLLLLINFASIAKKAYFEKCCSLLDLQQIQYALARALLGGNNQVCEAVFQITRFENFPDVAVAKHIANICNLNNATESTQQLSDVDDQWRNLNAMLKNHRTFVAKEIEQRLDALIEEISSAQRKNQIQNVPTSQIIELYNYRIENFNCAERSNQQRLENASSQITVLTQRINVQSAELEKYRSMNFELHINLERLQTQCKDLEQQKIKLKGSMTELLKQLSQQSEAVQINEKRLSVKMAEISVLQKECSELKSSLDCKIDELKKSEGVNKENILRIEKLKKSIIAYEQDIKEKLRTLEEREREISKTHKLLDEQREARKKSDDLVSVLEIQLQEKKEQVNALEMEQSETEELRKTIMSLMESKKPKRKA